LYLVKLNFKGTELDFYHLFYFKAVINFNKIKDVHEGFDYKLAIYKLGKNQRKVVKYISRGVNNG
jgi:hypothetical protein